MLPFQNQGLIFDASQSQNIDQLIFSLFERRCIELPESSFDWNSKYCNFSNSNSNCVTVSFDKDHILLSSSSENILSSSIDEILCKYDFSKEYLFINDSYKGKIQRLDDGTLYTDFSLEKFGIKVKKEFNSEGYIEYKINWPFEEETYYDEGSYIWLLLSYILYSNFDFGEYPPTGWNERITDLQFKERERGPINRYFILFQESVNEIDLDFYTGKGNRQDYENEITEKQSNISFAAKIWNELVKNNKDKGFFSILKVWVNMFFALVLLLLLSFVSGDNHIEYKRRLQVKISYIAYFTILIVLFLWLSFIKPIKEFSDVLRFLSYLIGGVFLSTTFLKAILLKKK